MKTQKHTTCTTKANIAMFCKSQVWDLFWCNPLKRCSATRIIIAIKPIKEEFYWGMNSLQTFANKLPSIQSIHLVARSWISRSPTTNGPAVDPKPMVLNLGCLKYVTWSVSKDHKDHRMSNTHSFQEQSPQEYIHHKNLYIINISKYIFGKSGNQQIQRKANWRSQISWRYLPVSDVDPMIWTSR